MKSGDGDETGLSIGGGRKVEMGMSVKRTRRRTRGLRIERLELRDLFAGDPIDGLGVLGDALSDEYFDQLIGVGASWVQILQSGRQIATGPTGTWGEPRRSGFEYNWGRKGATSADLQAQGQTQGLLGQIASGDVTHAVLMIGTEDFGLDKPTYQSLINGTLPPSQVDALVNQILDRLDTALADLRFSNAKVLLVNLADESLTPAARSFMPIAATRDRVSVVIDRVNAGLRRPGKCAPRAAARPSWSGSPAVGNEFPAGQQLAGWRSDNHEQFGHRCDQRVRGGWCHAAYDHPDRDFQLDDHRTESRL